MTRRRPTGREDQSESGDAASAPADARSWRDVARILAELDRRAAAAGLTADSADLAGSASQRTHDAVVAVAAERIPAAEWVSVTVRRGPHRFETAAMSDPRAGEADQVQYRLGSGPCVDAIVDDTIYCPADVRHDPKWPDFGKQVADLGVASMLAFRLSLDGGDLAACLNVYSTRPGAFDDDAVTLGEIVATHAALLISDQRSREAVEQLRGALDSNREIGMAMGIFMDRYKVTPDEAFDLLRLASQNANRKLRAVAAEVVETGELNVVRPRGERSRRHRS